MVEAVNKEENVQMELSGVVIGTNQSDAVEIFPSDHECRTDCMKGQLRLRRRKSLKYLFLGPTAGAMLPVPDPRIVPVIQS